MKKYKTKRILVTGGSGFIGNHLCRSLLHKGNEVICVDNFSTGKKTNIIDLMVNPRFEVIRHDICFPLHVEVDEIYNLACPASPKQYKIDPIQTMKTSVMGMINMLGLAKRTGAKILQASTSEIYGDPQEHPQSESYWGNVNTIGSRSCYDEGKRCAETLCMDYHKEHGVDVRIARIFNTYGESMQPDDGRVISNFIVACLTGGEITLTNGGVQTRSFCYISDMIKGLEMLMDRKNCNEPINLGNPEEYHIKEIADIICKKTGNKPTIAIPNDHDYDDPSQRKPDITRAKALLGWSPTVSLDLGLHLTLEYFKEIC